MGDSSQRSGPSDWLNTTYTRRDILKKGAVLAAIPALGGG